MSQEDLADGANLSGKDKRVSFRPWTFSGISTGDNNAKVESGGDVFGERPGQLPWQVFSVSTICLVLLWWAAAIVSAVQISTDATGNIKPFYGEALETDGLKGGKVHPTEMLQ